ncbi:MAG TPA: 50S ribosome-binding GTPase, partial [bacterium]|nr:50S ribosome-binding GTPase [bacterium]
MASKKINRLPVVTIVGRPNVGKSTLFNRIIGRQDAIVDGTPGVTRDRHYEIAEWRGKNFILIDTGGFIPDSHDLINTAIREQAQLAIDESDLVILLIDAVSQLSTTEMKIADVLKRSKKT